MSARELSKRLGISLYRINKYETGAAVIGAGQLLEIARELGVTVQYFFQDAPIGQDDQGPVRAPVAEDDTPGVVGFAESRDGVELNTAFAAIRREKTRWAIVHLARSLTPK